MKNILLFFASLCISITSLAQIVIQPSGQNASTPFTGGINGENNKPFWIGVGKFPHIYLDSSENHKVGIGSSIKGANFTFKHNYHAKLHVRYIGGSGSNFNTQLGPHLLLDEATTTSPAVLRFRQSSTTTSGIAPNIEENLVIGARYWDIRGFANGTSPTVEGLGDYLDFRNSGSLTPDPILSLRGGTGRVGINTDNPQSKLHVIGDGRFSPLSSGIVKVILNGVATGEEANISYDGNTKTLTLETDNNVRGLELNNGFVKVGSHSLAPAIKTWYNTITLSSTVGISTGLPMPTAQDKILSVDIMFNQNNGRAVDLWDWTLDNTTLYIENSQAGSVGKTVRVFITYKE